MRGSQALLVCSFWIWIQFCKVVRAQGDGKCLKDPDLAEIPINVYYCKEKSKPRCCQEENEFTCCEPEGTIAMREQLQLWGTLSAVIVIVAIVLLCYRKESYLCEGASLKDRIKSCCRCGKCKKKKDADIDEAPLDNLDEDPEPSSSGNTPKKQTPAPTPTYVAPGSSTQYLVESDDDSGRGSVTSHPPTYDNYKNTHLTSAADLATPEPNRLPPIGPPVEMEMMETEVDAGEKKKKKKKKKHKEEKESKKKKKKSKSSKHDAEETNDDQFSQTGYTDCVDI